MYLFKHKNVMFDLNKMSSAEMVEVRDGNLDKYFIKVNLKKNQVYLEFIDKDERMIIFDKIYNMLTK